MVLLAKKLSKVKMLNKKHCSFLDIFASKAGAYLSGATFKVGLSAAHLLILRQCH
jgi:hypothetical protein